nr:hypothetical protein [Tanacetum cinerariifolium]
VRDLSDEFEEFFVNGTNKVNAASTPVTTVGPNSTNSTNNFNVTGPSDNVVSPNFEIGGKSSFVDPSQYPNDPNMPVLEDIIYSDDEEDVGTEANFSNLETSIPVSPIPTTRVHKDHPLLKSLVIYLQLLRQGVRQGWLKNKNTDADAAFDDKESESEVHVSPSSSAKPKKHDEKAKR